MTRITKVTLLYCKSTKTTPLITLWETTIAKEMR